MSEEKQKQVKRARKVQRFFDDPKNASKAGSAPKTRWRTDIVQVMDTIYPKLNYAFKQFPELNDIQSILAYRLVEIATRDNNNPQIYCPVCREKHSVEATHPCPDCDTPLPVLSPDIPGEKNSIVALTKLMDKVFANKHDVSGQIDIEGKMMSWTDVVGSVIVKYVDPEKRENCLLEIGNLIDKFEGE